MKRFVLYFIGWFFIAVGIVCTLIPLVPQVPFYIIGIAILTSVSPRVRLWMRSLKVKYPKLKTFLDHSAARVRSIRDGFRKDK